jgi:UDP-3-O-[3-hydroxymyristoyl] glucosamine N-acyltransferase
MGLTKGNYSLIQGKGPQINRRIGIKKLIEIRASDVMADFSATGLISEILGDKNTKITGISAVEDCGPGDLIFIDKIDYIEKALDRKPSAIVTSPKLKDKFPASDVRVIFIAPNLGLAHAKIKGRYSSRDFDRSGWKNIHPSAVIHETATVDLSTVIEPHVVVGQNAKIGKKCRIMAGTVIENDAVVGDHTIIHPKVIVGYSCRIGSEVVIGAGSVIGSEGFGFAQDEKRKSHPIPQTGIVVIEDRVRVGANNCIDRAAYAETRIGAGTKLDNLCHIAHNVIIGEDCLLTSMLCIAGSSQIGDRVITSGQTGILDHVKVGNDIVLLHRAGVTKDIDTPGAYAGVPLMPLSEYLRNTAVLKNAVELKKRVSDLEKKSD